MCARVCGTITSSLLTRCVLCLRAFCFSLVRCQCGSIHFSYIISPLVGSGSLGCFQEHLRKDLSALRSFGLKGMRRPMRGKETAYGERSCVLEIVLCLWVPASSKCYGNSEGRFEERRRQDRRHKRRVKSHTLVFLRCVGCRRSKASTQTGRRIALGL